MAIFLAFSAGQASAAPAKTNVQAARIAGNDVRTRFVADLDKPVGYSVYVISDPYRVIVDMPGVVFNIPPSSGKAGRGLLTRFRFGQVEAGKSRIVIDAKGPVLIEKSFVLNATDGQPARMVIDVISTDERTFSRVKSNEPETRTAKPAPAENSSGPSSLAELLKREGVENAGGSLATVPKPRPKPNQQAELAKPETEAQAAGTKPKPPARPVIVLDPGHGGIDGGTSARGKVLEKNVVLAFARELRKKLMKSGRYEVLMTRNEDVFVSLGKRVKFARKHKADLFIAIHADSLRQRRVRGATVYTLSEEASDEEAAALAEKENASDIIGGINLGEEPDEEVAGILMDLALRETKNHSIYFARNVVTSLKRVSPLNRRPMRSAGFKVLTAPDVPSVLLELGYLSNRHDAKNLVSSAWRRKSAHAVSRAIDAFFSPEVAARQAASKKQ